MKRFANPSILAHALQRVTLGLAVLVLVGCGSADQLPVVDQASTIEMQREAEQAAATRAAEERVRIARVEAERERQAAAAREEAARIARQQEQEEAQRETQRLEAARIAAAEQARRAAVAREQTQRARIAELEAQIEQIRASNAAVASANSKFEEAIAAAQALLDALNAEQQKYANTTVEGELLVPLEKARIAELESRKDSLKREAQALSQQ